MRPRLIISALLVSVFTLAQPVKKIEPINLFTGYDSFCMNSYEEGVVYMWRWNDNRIIVLNIGGLVDLVFPKEYCTYDTYYDGNTKVVKAKKAQSTSFARKDVILKGQICVLYYNFSDTVIVDSLSYFVRNRLQDEL